MDSTPSDWLLTDGRHSVLGVIDLYSRRMVFFVSKTSSAKAVGQAFRKAVLFWGVPERIRTDNGKDYVSDYFSTSLVELEIVQDLCIPFALGVGSQTMGLDSDSGLDKNGSSNQRFERSNLGFELQSEGVISLSGLTGGAEVIELKRVVYESTFDNSEPKKLRTSADLLAEQRGDEEVLSRAETVERLYGAGK